MTTLIENQRRAERTRSTPPNGEDDGVRCPPQRPGEEINSTPPSRIDARLPRSLYAFAYLAALCTTAGVLLYCYDATLAAVRTVLIAIHEYSGDLSLGLLTAYLVVHLKRAWPLRRARALSWWTGLLAAAVWLLVGATGVYGQFTPLVRFAPLWWVHGIGSLVVVVITSFHAAYGFRRWVRRQIQERV